MNTLLYEIPEKFVSQVSGGQAKVVGALIKDKLTGQVLAHVQPTSAFEKILGSALQGVSSTISQGFNPLGVLTAVQNEQIKSRLANIQTSLGLMQNLQIGTLAVSGLGLGVSVAGFAMMLHRLKGIEAHLVDLKERIDLATAERRSDDIQGIFSVITADLETVDTLHARRDASRVAEEVQISLSRSASRLQPHFSRVSENHEDMTNEDLDLLWSLAAAIRLCSDASFKALFHIDELAVAGEIARKQAERFAQLSAPLSADRLARLCAQSAENVEMMSDMRNMALPAAQVLVGGLRQSAIQAESQASLASILIERGASGRQYLEELETETEAPLLYLPG
ncbi:MULTISPECIES: hypothetical protein [unclassified Ruegeria]|uniref:hypothetical protein n=1 Tax=unclassified Ruegeria TaxID=2625375 RepID=UPI001489D7C9|nr:MULTISPECIES: hypothetical protein [unclassified Ruegeria]